MATDLLNKNKEQGIIELFKKEFLRTQGTLEQLNELWGDMKETMDENDESGTYEISLETARIGERLALKLRDLATIVQDIFTMYADGKRMQEIVDWLKAKNICTQKGKPMRVNVIQYMLSNRKYIGEYKYRNVVIPDGIPAIISQELFGRVQERLVKNKKAPARHKAEDDYLLTTKLFCGKCGAYMVGESGRSCQKNV